jgi:protein JSN1
MSSTRPEHLGLGFSHSAGQPRSGSPSTSNSPSDPSSRSPFGLPGGVNPAGVMAANTRSGTGSPSHDLGGPGRLFSKRYAVIVHRGGNLKYTADHI